ncbi:tyrosine-type recombinase/integrase [Maritalea sp.]|uniref:tyrosine-type recombinase/integrase n=1 Tax=Maritalea sp. TaxID=2003361 RepID=UPI003EF0D1CF
MAQAAIAYRESGRATRFLEKVEDYWKDTVIRNITGEAVRLSAKKLYPSAKPATWNRQVIVPTQAIINYASELGWCSSIKVKRFPHDPATKTPATLEWVNAFSTQATEDGLPHLAALCMFMFGTAARVGEAVRMTWADVDLQTGKAKLSGNKPTPWSRTAHMPPRVVSALANIPSNRNSEDHVFKYSEQSSTNKVWGNVIERAEIDYLTPHCCRHGFATTMLQAGYDVKTVAECGGWKDPAVVLRTYAHALEDKTVTNSIFDTTMTHGEKIVTVSSGNKRVKQ